MKKYLLAAGLFSLAALLSGAENLMKDPAVSYKVFPGSWNRKLLQGKLGLTLDPDLDLKTGTRKGLLTDGKTFQRAVVYNYHRAAREFCFVTIEVDLGKPRTLSEIRVMAVENNSLYRPAKIEISGGPGNLVCEPLGSSTEWKKKQYVRTAAITGSWSGCRFLRIRVYSAAGWINVSEIEVYGK